MQSEGILILGIAISEENIIVKDNDESVTVIPFVISKKSDGNGWSIGKDAYEDQLNNKGVLIDRILYLLETDSEITVYNNKYTYNQILTNFFNILLNRYDDIENVAISLYNNNIKVINIIQQILLNYFNDINKFKIITYSDSIIEYIKKLDDKLSSHNVGVIEFSNKNLIYYEVMHGFIGEKKYLYVDKKDHAPVPVELLSQKLGSHICDNILYDFAKEVTQKKQYSCFILIGNGFKNQDQYRDFINFICSLGCQVLKEEYLIAIGAYLFASSKNDKDIYVITDSTTIARVSFEALVNRKLKRILQVDFGEFWFYKICDFDIIVDDEKEFILYIEKLNGEVKKIAFNLSQEFDIRNDMSTRLSVRIDFSQQYDMNVLIVDKGFGPFYHANNKRSNIPVSLK